MMSEATTLLSHNWAFAIFLLGVFGLIGFMLGVSSLLGSKAFGRSKNEPFESGMLPTGGARLRLSAKFYLVAMVFLLFGAGQETTTHLISGGLFALLTDAGQLRRLRDELVVL